jgi:endo-1,4-beta-xylanase
VQSSTWRGARSPCHLRSVSAAIAALWLGACAPPEMVGTEGEGGTTGGAAGTPGVAGSAGGGQALGGAAGLVASGGTSGVGQAGAPGSGGRGGQAGAIGRGGTDGGQGGAFGGGGSAGDAARGGAGGVSAAAGRGGGAGGGGAGRGGAGGGSAGAIGAGGAPPLGKKFVGNIDTRGQVRSDFVTYWNQITPENAGKWGSIEGTRNKMNWGGLDAIHDYAKQHGIPFKGHNLIWGSQQPGWISGLSQADQRAEVEEWIRLYCERYPDTQLIDVVNEPPPHTTPSYTAALGGAGSSGYDWIVQAFKWARQYCPNTTLILNDYNNIEYGNDNSHTIDIVKRIKAAGAPIGGVGAQAHACASISASTIQMYIDKIATETGVPVYISEYDLNIADDNQQKSVMQSQFTMFWNDANVAGITLWGYIVGSTWEANTGLITSSGSMRPAMTWLMGFLGR